MNRRVTMTSIGVLTDPPDNGKIAGYGQKVGQLRRPTRSKLITGSQLVRVLNENGQCPTNAKTGPAGQAYGFHLLQDYFRWFSLPPKYNFDN